MNKENVKELIILMRKMVVKLKFILRKIKKKLTIVSIRIK